MLEEFYSIRLHYFLVLVVTCNEQNKPYGLNFTGGRVVQDLNLHNIRSILLDLYQSQ